MVEGKPRSPVLTFGLIEILKESVCKGNGSRVQVWAAFGTTSKGLRSLLEKRIRLQLTENMGVIHGYERSRVSPRRCEILPKYYAVTRLGLFPISILESRGAQKLTDAVSQRSRLRLRLRGQTSRQRM